VSEFDSLNLSNDLTNALLRRRVNNSWRDRGIEIENISLEKAST
jgi:hypothetical protein